MTMITIVRIAACIIIIIINDKKGDFTVRFCSLLEILHASLIGGFKNKAAFLSEAPLKFVKVGDATTAAGEEFTFWSK